jgi:hypothetical protein
MAKCLNPLMATESRGRVGGLVYNTWRGLNTVKQQTAPAQPRSSLQLQVRAWMVYLVRFWANISSTNRGLWNGYAQTHTEVDGMGATKRLAGINWFCRLNIRLLKMGIAIQQGIPLVAAPAAPAGFTVTDGVGELTFNRTPLLSGNYYHEVYIFGPHSAGVAAKIQRARHQDYYSCTGPGPFTITGLVPGTYTLWLRTVSQDDGQASSFVVDTGIVT